MSALVVLRSSDDTECESVSNFLWRMAQEYRRRAGGFVVEYVRHQGRLVGLQARSVRNNRDLAVLANVGMTGVPGDCMGAIPAGMAWCNEEIAYSLERVQFTVVEFHERMLHDEALLARMEDLLHSSKMTLLSIDVATAEHPRMRAMLQGDAVRLHVWESEESEEFIAAHLRLCMALAA